MKDNKLEEIKIETPKEQQDQPIPTEEWYYIPFTRNIGVQNNYWDVAFVGTDDMRIKQKAFDILTKLSWINPEDKKIVKIRMPIHIAEPQTS